MRNTIKKHLDFITGPDAPSATAAFFVVRAKKTSVPNDPRYGLVASKRTFRFAVQRNRAKRLLRDWIAANDDFMSPEYDYIFIARSAILGASRDEGRAAMARALEHIRKKYVA